MPIIRRLLFLFPLLICFTNALAAPPAEKTKAPPPSEAARFYNGAGIFQRQGRVDYALSYMNKAIQLEPKDPVYLAYQAELQKLYADYWIDQQALKAPLEVEQDVDRLAAWLTRSTLNDRAKARAIFRWIADRISYDVHGLGKERLKLKILPKNVLDRRTSVCEGYARLYEALANKAGLEAVMVSGFAKDPKYVPGQEFKSDELSHAWNAVKIDGKWQLLDVTWAAGGIDGDKFVKKFDDYYFFTPPDEFFFSHYPSLSRWQLTSKEMTEKDFKRWTRPPDSLFRLGVSASKVREKLDVSGARPLVAALPVQGTKISLENVPLDGRLRADTKYRFRIAVRGVSLVLIGPDRKPVPLPRSARNRYDLDLQSPKGSLIISGVVPEQPNRILPFLIYKVD